MELDITIQIWQKGKWYVAKCPELDFISQGETKAEAKNNLFEVIQIQFEEMNENMKKRVSLYSDLSRCNQ